MGLFQSLSKSVNDNTRTCAPKKNIEIGILLSKLDANPSKDESEFKIINRLEVDTRKLQMSLATMIDNETFKQFDTYQMISEKMPVFVLEKQPRVDDTTCEWDFQRPRYYDIYGTNDIDDIKQILITYISTDIADIVLQYCGDGPFLFSVKTGNSGGMTLTTYTLVVGDALTIHSTYSEKSGRSNRVRVNKDYDKKLLMYLAYIIHEISEVGSYNQRTIFYRDHIEFHFPAFMAFEILEKPRPPPRERICVVGDCLVAMDCGLKAAKDIRAGDVVQTADGSITKVVCTVTQRIANVIEICRVGKCYITTEHPIRKLGSSEWVIPCDVVDAAVMYVDVINNFVLETGHCIIVDTVECITLGHMFCDPVVKHQCGERRLYVNF